jgi:hypothetical protein
MRHGIVGRLAKYRSPGQDEREETEGWGEKQSD